MEQVMDPDEAAQMGTEGHGSGYETIQIRRLLMRYVTCVDESKVDQYLKEFLEALGGYLDFAARMEHAVRYYADDNHWRGAMAGHYEFTPDTEFTVERNEWKADMGEVARRVFHPQDPWNYAKPEQADQERPGTSTSPFRYRPLEQVGDAIVEHLTGLLDVRSGRAFDPTYLQSLVDEWNAQR